MGVGFYPGGKGNPQQVFKQQPDMNGSAFLRGKHIRKGEVESGGAAVGVREAHFWARADRATRPGEGGRVE